MIPASLRHGLAWSTAGFGISIALNASPLRAAGSTPAERSATGFPPLAYPAGTTAQVIQILLLIAAGIGILVLVNHWVTLIANRPGSASLAREARDLRRLTIGYPEGMRYLEALREERLLEKRLGPLGLTITWTPYPSASTLLAALSEGSIDFCGGGGTASIFSQAAEHLFVRVAREKYPDLQGEAILVPEDSPIQNLLDLRGRRIGFDEGSSAHYVLIRALQTVGLSYSDIQPIPLPQAEALQRFEQGELEAWVVWMPYAPTPARRTYPGRSIANLYSILGDKAASEVPTLYYAIPELVRDYPRLLKALLEEVNEAGVLINRLQFEEALERNRASEFDPEVLETLYQHTLERSILPLDEPTLRSLQHQASTLLDLRLIAEPVNVHDARYSLRTRQNWTY